jgi:hypothetical protein
MIPQIGLCSAIVLGVLFGSTYPASAESYRVCIGQYEHKCPAAKDAWFKCRTSIQSAGQSVCTIFTPSGPRYRNWSYRTSYDKEGNQCGYLGIVVTCL